MALDHASSRADFLALVARAAVPIFFIQGRRRDLELRWTLLLLELSFPKIPSTRFRVMRQNQGIIRCAQFSRAAPHVLRRGRKAFIEGISGGKTMARPRLLTALTLATALLADGALAQMPPAIAAPGERT